MPLNILTPLPVATFKNNACEGCREETSLPFGFTMAFQPIVNMASGEVFAHEALVRGPEQQGAGTILSLVDEENKYAFDQACRVRAIEMASRLSWPRQPSRVSINFIPGAVYEPQNCIRRTLETAARVGMPLENIIFEVTESEQVKDRAHLMNIFSEYRKHGLRTAIDDFGAGHAGLTLLAAFQPDVLKIDMELIRTIDQRKASRRIVQAITEVCRDLGILVIAEGIETVGECSALVDLGIELFQGYLFAKPAFESFATPAIPVLDETATARMDLVLPESELRVPEARLGQAGVAASVRAL
jgi:EAL domain-containing protein (putative c-di-GMP-specific phosphodiesterase class I)